MSTDYTPPVPEPAPLRALFPNRKVVDIITNSPHAASRALAELIFSEQQAGWKLHSWTIVAGTGADSGKFMIFVVLEAFLLGDVNSMPGMRTEERIGDAVLKPVSTEGP